MYIYGVFNRGRGEAENDPQDSTSADMVGALPSNSPPVNEVSQVATQEGSLNRPSPDTDHQIPGPSQM